jgi:hypothetical protein
MRGFATRAAPFTPPHATELSGPPHLWRRWGWLTFWLVPASLTVEILGLAAWSVAPRGGALEAAALVLLVLPLALVAGFAAIAALALAAAAVARPWRWAAAKTLDWRVNAR